MTKKDYELIAKGLAKTGNRDYVDESSAAAWYLVCNDMADTLAQDNPSFDRNKFLKACGAE